MRVVPLAALQLPRNAASGAPPAQSILSLNSAFQAPSAIKTDMVGVLP